MPVVRIQPGLLIAGRKVDRHPIVDTHHQIIGGGRDDRARGQFALWSSPGRMEPGKNEDPFPSPRSDEERLLQFPVPFHS